MKKGAASRAKNFWKSISKVTGLCALETSSDWAREIDIRSPQGEHARVLTIGRTDVWLSTMKTLLLLVGFCILAILCWPLAVLALLLLPLIWLISLPFRLVFSVVEAAFALVRALLFLPARLLGWKAS
jgi:ABC-type phosphate/phosphonate transport system permease subunit